MAEPVKIPFDIWTGLGPKNNIVDGMQVYALDCAL